jgi:hypothetical protein
MPDDGSPESQVINNFVHRIGGGVFEPTENAFWFNEARRLYGELEAVYARLEGEEKADTDVSSELARLYDQLDEARSNRDYEVAYAINVSLRDGDIGFVFRGGMHDITPHLPKDIQTEVLDERLIELVRELTEPQEKEGQTAQPEMRSTGGSEGKG